jgi:hypothetical protein
MGTSGNFQTSTKESVSSFEKREKVNTGGLCLGVEVGEGVLGKDSAAQLTQEVRRRLRICGYSDQEIAHMTPETAHAILAQQAWLPGETSEKASTMPRDDDKPPPLTPCAHCDCPVSNSGEPICAARAKRHNGPVRPHTHVSGSTTPFGSPSCANFTGGMMTPCHSNSGGGYRGHPGAAINKAIRIGHLRRPNPAKVTGKTSSNGEQ